MKYQILLLLTALEALAQISIVPDSIYLDSAFAYNFYDSSKPVFIINNYPGPIVLQDIYSKDTFNTWLQLDSIDGCPPLIIVSAGNSLYADYHMKPASINPGDSIKIARIYVQTLPPSMCGDCFDCTYDLVKTNQDLIFVFSNQDTLALHVAGFGIKATHHHIGIQKREAKLFPANSTRENTRYLINGKKSNSDLPHLSAYTKSKEGTRSFVAKR